MLLSGPGPPPLPAVPEEELCSAQHGLHGLLEGPMPTCLKETPALTTQASEERVYTPIGHLVTFSTSFSSDRDDFTDTEFLLVSVCPRLAGQS